VITFAQFETTTLTIKLNPSSIESGEKSHKIGYVGFTNSYGNLIKISKDVTISLASENPAIASVPSIVTIPAGSQFAAFEVQTTTNSGQVRIFASFGDDINYDTLIVGEEHDVENDLKLIVNLPTSEMNVNSEIPFSFYLQNSQGDITQAPFDIPISLEYEESLIKVEMNDPTIKKGNSYVLGVIKSKDRIGNAYIRASADNVGFDEAKEIRISSSLPSSLSVQIFPEKVPATLKRDLDIVVSLIDSDGLPTFAQDDIKIQFFSDDQSINDQIDKKMKESQLNGVIKKGEFSYHFTQRIDLSKENKTISIGATTKGLGVAEDTFETVKPLTTNNPIAANKTMQIYTIDKIPTKSQTIAVFQIGTLFEKQQEESSEDVEVEKEFFPLIVNENYDSAGADQKINLISSNDLLLKIKDGGNIGTTSSYGTAIIESGQETGHVVLSSTIKGIGAASVQTEIVNTLKQEKTMIFSPTGTSSILFDKNGYFDLFVISLDSKGRPTTVENEARYLMTPINQILTIQKEKTYAHVTFLGNSIQSENEEQMTIRTVPIGESADPNFEVQNTFDKKPTAKIAISIPFETLNLEKDNYSGVVQIFDFRDNPITLQEDLIVRLTQSDLGVVNIPEYVVIPKGISYAEFPIQTSGDEGVIALDASTKGIVGGTTEIEARSGITKLKISIGSVNEPLLANSPAELKIYIDDEEQNSVSGVTVKVVSDDSVVSPSVVTTGEDGSAIVQLNAKQEPKMSLQILASAEGYSEEQKTFEFEVSGGIEENKTILPEWVIYAGMAGVAGIAGGTIFFLKKPKKQLEDEEEIYE
jgi:hypothetical protein